MAALRSWDVLPAAACVRHPQIASPSADCHPSKRSSRRNARFLGYRYGRPIVSLQVGVADVVEITHNKVLVAAAFSGAIGRLFKPFSRVLLKGKETFDLRAAIESGGFPSSHSSAVVATAASLLFERGLADPIFGLSVVYAAIVMYDAQGVRREVGEHARLLNKTLMKEQVNSCQTEIDFRRTGRSLPVNASSTGQSLSEKGSSSSVSKWENTPLVLGSDRSVSVTEERRVQTPSGLPVDESRGLIEEELVELLKEPVGHTEVEVLAGALLGFSVSMAVHTFM